MACVFMLGSFCFPATAAQLKLSNLYKLCTSSTDTDKVACRFYILGAFEGLQVAGEARLDKSGNFTRRRTSSSVYQTICPVRPWNSW